MNSSKTTESSKNERVTQEQLETFLEFHRAHPEIGARKKRSLTSKEIRELWKQLAVKLNACTGPNRTVGKWRETLSGWKCQLRSRAERLKMRQNADEDESRCKALSDFEKTALATIGPANVDFSERLASLDPMCSQEGEPVALEYRVSHLSSHSSSPPPSPSAVPLFNIEPTPCASTSPSLLKQYETNSARCTSRKNHTKKIKALIANIENRDAAENQKQRRRDEQRQEHRELMQAIQGLTNTMADLINILQSESN